MTIVLDSNVLVQIFGARSPFLAIQRAILDGRVTLAFSTGILLEYEEVLSRYGGPRRWQRVWQVIENTDQLHQNIRHVEPPTIGASSRLIPMITSLWTAPSRGKRSGLSPKTDISTHCCRQGTNHSP